MQRLSEQFETKQATVGHAKVSFRLADRMVTMNRGVLMDPRILGTFLRREGFMADQIGTCLETVYAEGDLRSLLRQYDPKGSVSKKKAAANNVSDGSAQISV